MAGNNSPKNISIYKEDKSEHQNSYLGQNQALSSNNLQQGRRITHPIFLVAVISLLVVVLIIYNVQIELNKQIIIVQTKKSETNQIRQDQLIKDGQKNRIDLTLYKNKIKLNKDVDRITYFPIYSKFNYNLAHYLLEKKGIDNLTCLNCSEQSINYLKSTKFYDLMKIDNQPFKNDSFWIHWNSTDFCKSIEEVRTLIDFIKKRDNQNLKGFSLFWSNRTLYMKSQIFIRDNLLQYISFMNFHYVEPVSLGLRFMEDGVIMIFEKQKPVYKPNNLPYNPKILGIQLTFQMYDNIQFMREWLLYHIHIGFSRFFLYDNTWSDSYGKVPKYYMTSNKTHDRYGHQLRCSSNQTVWISMFKQICEDFDQYLIYIPWQKYQNGQIQMQQINASLTYLYYYQEIVRWTFYSDFDQFLFSARNFNVMDYVLKKQKQKFTALIISQYKMISRFCLTDKIVNEANLALKIDGFKWAPKVFMLNIAAKMPAIHSGLVHFGNTAKIDPNDLRFNHYNLNLGLYHHSLKTKWALNQQIYTDDLMKNRFAPILKLLCKNKCSDTYKMICPYQTQASCPKLTNKTKP